MVAESAAPSAPAMVLISSSPPTTFFDRNDDFFTSFVHDNSADLILDLTPMPQFFNPDSPTSSLSTPTTQTSFEDSQSSISSAYTSASSQSDHLYLDAFNSASSFFDGSLFAPSPFIELRPETPFFVNPFDSYDMSCLPFEYKHLDPIHRSIEMPASPQPLSMPTFSQIESYERTARPFQHAPPTFSSSYNSSSEDTTSDAPAPPPLPKKPARVSKQDKGIKCDHCGVDKTPLWRKVPHKENAYHCNACGLYYKSNGHFRALEGETRIIRSKKPRKNNGDTQQAPSTFRSGPVTANRNLSCANCGTNTTVLWRKGPDGQSPLCNPCGLFYKLHGSHRSPEKKKEIHRRNRTGKKRYSISTEKSSWSSAEEGDDEVESPVLSEFAFRRQSQNGYVKAEEKDYSERAVPYLSPYMEHQYQYQWQGQSV